MHDRDPRLAPFTTYELLDELRARFMDATGLHRPGQVILAGPSGPQPAPKPTILAGPPPEKLPKGIVKAETIPNRFIPDGSPRRLLTAGVPKELEERLTVTPQSLAGRDEFDGKTQFIVKGPEREILANAMIQSWKDEIEELENQLAQVSDEEDRATIESNIRRLRGQIALRSDSAFGGMTTEEARARNVADNPGGVTDAPSEAAVPGRGWTFIMASGLPEWDTPAIVETPSLGLSARGAQTLARAINEDPICGHIRPALPDVTAFDDSVTFKIVAEPSVLYRLAYHWERACAAEKRDPTPLYNALAEITKEHAVCFRTTADNYRGAWTSYLKGRYTSPFSISGDQEGMSLKRAVRILNPDFREQEAPDSFYEQTDGASPYGQQRRPHINVREAWDSTEQGPGVFRMSRRAAQDPDDDLPEENFTSGPQPGGM